MAVSTKLKTVLSSKIVNILQQEIYENIIKVGEHFNETAIAFRLGISSDPLRDVIRILENEGFVSTPPNGRTIVMDFLPKEVAEYYELRYYLESQAIRKILSGPEDRSYQYWLKKREELLARSRQYLKYEDKELFAEADYTIPPVA